MIAELINDALVREEFIDKMKAVQIEKSYNCPRCYDRVQDLITDIVCLGCRNEINITAEAYRIIDEQK